MISLIKTLSKIVSSLDGLERRDLLWTNPDANNIFSGRTIRIPNIDDYNDFEIVYLVYYDSGIPNQYQSIRSDFKNTITIEATEAGQRVYNFWINTREAVRTSTGIKFDDGWTKNQNKGDFYTSNNAIVPYKIYGYRYVCVGGGTA